MLGTERERSDALTFEIAFCIGLQRCTRFLIAAHGRTGYLHHSWSPPPYPAPSLPLCWRPFCEHKVVILLLRALNHMQDSSPCPLRCPHLSSLYPHLSSSADSSPKLLCSHLSPPTPPDPLSSNKYFVQFKKVRKTSCLRAAVLSRSHVHYDPDLYLRRASSRIICVRGPQNICVLVLLNFCFWAGEIWILEWPLPCTKLTTGTTGSCQCKSMLVPNWRTSESVEGCTSSATFDRDLVVQQGLQQGHGYARVFLFPEREHYILTKIEYAHSHRLYRGTG